MVYFFVKFDQICSSRFKVSIKDLTAYPANLTVMADSPSYYALSLCEVSVISLQ